MPIYKRLLLFMMAFAILVPFFNTMSTEVWNPFSNFWYCLWVWWFKFSESNGKTDIFVFFFFCQCPLILNCFFLPFILTINVMKRKLDYINIYISLFKIIVSSLIALCSLNPYNHLSQLQYMHVFTWFSFGILLFPTKGVIFICRDSTLSFHITSLIHSIVTSFSDITFDSSKFY